MSTEIMSRNMLITAGPTHEPIDAVRYLANRSSGAMGIEIASAATVAGWRVTLLLGPTHLSPPDQVGVATHRFESCQDLADLLDEHFVGCDVLIMAAAVADYTPAVREAGKINRLADGLTLHLEATPDLVARCVTGKQPNQRIVGFSLESPDALIERATSKMTRKGVDAIVANPLKTMNAAEIDGAWVQPDSDPIKPGVMSKQEFASWLVERVDHLCVKA